MLSPDPREKEKPFLPGINQKQGVLREAP